MMEKITINITIKKYLENFLISLHNSNPVKFHRNDSINLLIRNLLIKQPINKCINKGSLSIILPYNNIKDPRVYNYLSQNSINIIEKHIYYEFYAVFHRHMKKYDNILTKKSAALYFMELFNLNESIIELDTLLRNYRRYLNKKSNKFNNNFQVLSLK